MRLSTIITGLKNRAVLHNGTYQAARATRDALAPYATVAQLFDTIAFASPLPAEPRRAIMMAVIAEYQAMPHPLWQAVLVHAYEPMLRRLAARKGEDAEQDVVMAFLGAVGRLPRSGDVQNLPVYLRVATERALFRARPAESDDEENDAYDDDAFGDGSSEARLVAVIDLRRVIAEEPNARELMNVLYATIVEEESLAAYVAREFEALPPRARQRAYLRLQQQRHRLLGRLRNRLGLGGRSLRIVFEAAAQ